MSQLNCDIGEVLLLRNCCSHGSEHGPPDADATLTEAAEDLARSPSPTPAEKDLLVRFYHLSSVMVHYWPHCSVTSTTYIMELTQTMLLLWRIHGLIMYCY